jgi:hypothetical protein
MLNATKEQELLEALQVAERRADRLAIEQAVSQLALFYVATEQFSAGVPFWRRGAELLEMSTAPDSAELATYLHNMAATCLIPAGLRDEAHATLMRARELYRLHFRADAPWVKDVEELLR